MARPNTRTHAPEALVTVWNGAVGGNTSTVQAATDLCARVITVGVLPVGGTLVVTQLGGGALTYSEADIIAAGYILHGQFEQITAAGSTAHTLKVGW